MQKSFAFSNIETGYASENVATKAGITSKTLILLGIMLLSGIGSGYYLIKVLSNQGNASLYGGILFGSLIVAFIAAMVGRLSRKAAKPASFVYSIAEGLTLGALTTLLDLQVPGIGFAAAASTAGIFTVMVTLYHFNIIRPTRKFQAFLLGFGISLIVLIIVTSIAFRNTTFSPMLVIGIEAIFIAFGALSLIQNFGELDALVAMGADKGQEWSCALGLSITLAYIYVYVLRMLYFVYRIFGDR